MYTKSSQQKSAHATWQKWALVSLMASTLLTACPAQQPTQSAPEAQSQMVEAALATEWMELVRTLVKETGTNPPSAARIYGYTSVALYESVRAGFPEQPSLAGRLQRLPSLPAFEADKNYVLAEVLRETLTPVIQNLFPTLSEASAKTLADLNSKTAQRPEVKNANTAELERSRTQGQALAKALIAWSQSDGYAEVRQQEYTLPDFSQDPALWQPTAPNQKALEPFWGELKPLALASVDTCPTAPTVSFSTAIDSAFYAQAQEVQEAVNTLTPEQQHIAKWWADDPGKTATPPGHWVSIIGKVAQQEKHNLPETAKAYAYTGIALMDAFIACWKSKYIHNLVRPLTYIQQIMGDKDWGTYINTPPFPEYPSGHSTGSGAAAEMLTQLWGEVAFEDQTNAHLEMEARSFTSFNHAAEEAAISRLYGGIHYRDAIDQGVSQGRCVTSHVLKQLEGS